jgi:hypothetical protein
MSTLVPGGGNRMKAGIGPWPLRRGAGSFSGHLLLSFNPLPAWLNNLLASLAFTGLRATVGVAILGHRLYTIDVVINLTQVYGWLAMMRAGV